MVKKKKQPEKRIKRNHKFQLNIAKPVESWLDGKIEALTKERKFSQYVRDGLSLMIHFAEWGIAAQSVYDLFVQLRNGETDKLFEMFPHLQGRVGQGVSPSGGVGQLDKIESMLEIALAEKSTDKKYQMQSALPTPAAKAPPKAEVKAAPVMSADSIADNFLSMFQ